METMQFSAMYASACPTRKILDLIGDKWTVMLLGLLENGSRRFSDLRRGIDGISHKMLTQTLRNMERDGLITRTVYPEVPPRVEYELTLLGETLCGPIAEIRNWAEGHIDEVIAAQVAYDSAHE